MPSAVRGYKWGYQSSYPWIIWAISREIRLFRIPLSPPLYKAIFSPSYKSNKLNSLLENSPCASCAPNAPRLPSDPKLRYKARHSASVNSWVGAGLVRQLQTANASMELKTHAVRRRSELSLERASLIQALATQSLLYETEEAGD